MYAREVVEQIAEFEKELEFTKVDEYCSVISPVSYYLGTKAKTECVYNRMYHNGNLYVGSFIYRQIEMNYSIELKSKLNEQTN